MDVKSRAHVEIRRRLTMVGVEEGDATRVAQAVFDRRRIPNLYPAPVVSDVEGVELVQDWIDEHRECLVTADNVARLLTAIFKDDDVYALGCDLAAMTHGHPAGYDASGALALMISRLRQGDTLKEATEKVIQAIDGEEDPRGRVCGELLRMVLQLAQAEKPSYRRVERIGGGSVAEEALVTGVYCTLVATGFRNGALLAVNQGGNSDSTGSTAGDLLGAMLGVEAIPRDWLNGPQHRSGGDRVANDLDDAWNDERVFPMELCSPW